MKKEGFVFIKGNEYFPGDMLKRDAYPNEESIYDEAEKDPVKFWEGLAREGIEWFKTWEKGYEEKLPFFKWFKGGKTNICYNAVDRNVKAGYGKDIALIWVPEPVKEKTLKITYNELYARVQKTANALKKLGVKKGDVVAIYLPMIPEAVISMLACTRIGAIHSVVFSAFSADALKTRIEDGGAKLLITSDGYYRKGIENDLISKARGGVQNTPVKKTIVVNRLKQKTELKENEFWFDELIKAENEKCEYEEMESNETSLILYTSGTTGKPKGILHDTGGYAVQAYYTARWDFDLKEDTVMWCTADIGWITGHTYCIYGPLLNGVTTLLYEGMIDFPDPGRCWKIIEENKVNVFYTAPTALRMFKSYGDEWPKKYDLSSLKILGTVGEPIDNSTWLWYFENIGKKNCPLIDTWWQTETGGTLINALPGIGPFTPSVAGRSFPGTRHDIVDDAGKKVKDETAGNLVQLSPFAPGMLRGVWKNDEMYKEKYWQYKDKYFTGDGAIKDKRGHFKILGRVDDVIKVAGHRMSTAEMEDAVIEHGLINEAAVVSKPDAMKGEVPVVFARQEKNIDKNNEEKIKQEIIALIVKKIGPIAKPSEIYFVEDLPKTRSGKIMRRVLKSLLRNEDVGNVTTLVNPECVEMIRKKVGEKK